MLWAVDPPPGTPDREIVETSEKEARVLLTNDKDFGDLAVRSRLATVGIILLRFSTSSQYEKLKLFTDCWSIISIQASGCLIVVPDTKIRIRPL